LRAEAAALSDKPTKVQLFHTCLINHFFPDAGRAVVDVLEKLGLEVNVPLQQTCCGQPAYNAGFHDEARKIAQFTVQLLERTEGTIIIPSGSCADMLIHQYALLFEADDDWLSRLQSVTDRCFEFSQFLVDLLGVKELGTSFPARAAYHPSCHLLRGMQVDKQPLALLRAVADLELVPFAEPETCCGFGGLFAVKHAAISGQMLQNKLSALTASGAEYVIACDMGCLMHLEGGLHRQGSDLKVRHLAEVLMGNT